MGPLASPARGFTLLEVLVVAAILAIGAALTIATLERDERGIIEREARRFAGAVEHATLRAQVRHQTLGVSAVPTASGSSWQFWLRGNDGRWQAVADDPLAPHSLPARIRIAPVAFAGRTLPADAIVPLRASGRNEPYSFALSGDAYGALVSADPLNRVAIAGPRVLEP